MFTIAALPKPFIGHIGLIQRNAIGSWLALTPRPQIILFGNEEGTAAVAREFGLQHVSQVESNRYGTPYLRAVFLEAEKRMKGEVLCYSNCDIILLQDFVAALEGTRKTFPRFLLVGECKNLDVKQPIGFASPDWESNLRDELAKHGKRRAHCADYFAFPHGMYKDVPPVVLGRAYFDNWVMWDARHRGIPLVNGTQRITAIHQNHLYSALPGMRGIARNAADEPQENLKILGKGNIYWITDSTHTLTPRGITRDLSGTLQLRRRAKHHWKQVKYWIVDTLRALKLHE